jgi:two-component system cell cycle response regulator
MLTATDIPVKPRILIADDSRIVRATLIKHIEGMFEFREALDGEQAWEALLLDQSIRVVITDLTMPRLDGYGLLRRIRNSRVSRIRDIPVIVVSGSDEREERERAKAAGANDLITKGIATAQLLSRLDVFSRLVTQQSDLERGLEALVGGDRADTHAPLISEREFCDQATTLLEQAQKTRRNFVLLSVCIALRSADGAGSDPAPTVMDAIGQLLRRTVRQTDHVARTGDTQFTLAVSGINAQAARIFGQRVARAIAGAQLVNDDRFAFVASCGLASLNEGQASASLETMRQLSHARALLGLQRGLNDVIGPEEENKLRPQRVSAGEGMDMPDVGTLLQWLREGRQSDVLPYIGKLSNELQPLVDLLRQQNKG